METSRKQNKTLNNFKEMFKVNAGAIGAFAVIFIISIFLSPKFFTLNNMMTILRTNAGSSLVAFGMTFVILTGNIDISVGSYMTLCGCLSAMLIGKANFPTFAAIAVSFLVSIVFGIINGVLVSKINIPPFIATLATMNVMRGTCYVMTNGKPVVFSKGIFTEIGGGYLGIFPLPSVYMIVIFIILWIILNKTRFGRRIYAVGGNSMAARYSGVNVEKTITGVFVISGILSCAAGVLLISRLGSGQPTIGEGAELDAIASCVVGGVNMNGGSGTLVGTLFGCLLIGVIGNILNLVGVNSYIQLIVKGVIIVLSICVGIMRDKIASKKK